MVMLKLSSSEGPDPDAQADRSPEPDMADSQVVPEVRPSARTQAGFAALDLINVRDIFTQRACVMKVPPAFLRGACRSAMRTALSEITSGMALRNNTRVVREDALVQASQGRQGAQERSLGPVHQVRAGSVVGSLDPERGSICIRHRDAKQEEKDRDGFRGETGRTSRGIDLLWVRFPAARRALEASPVAPGTEATYRALTHVRRRPPEPRDGHPRRDSRE